MTTMTSTEIDWNTVEKGTEVRISGVRGSFIFQYFRNGEVTVYGGDRNPNGHRMFRTFVPERCRIFTPRNPLRAYQPGPSVPPLHRRRGGR